MHSDPKLRDNFMEKAMLWYDMAAKQGHIPSKVGYAKMCLEDPTRENVEKAMAIYEEADKAKNVDATYNLGFVAFSLCSHVDLLRRSLQRSQGSREGLRVSPQGSRQRRHLRLLLPRLRSSSLLLSRRASIAVSSRTTTPTPQCRRPASRAKAVASCARRTCRRVSRIWSVRRRAATARRSCISTRCTRTEMA